ncbi:hypothetical protein [Atopobium fossor]|uniref:hypothetical protein n=1 Tax=Atopobium fossor TaxID=39487 RepID=UPI0004086DB1|nr:hypothetical protein [Atopobium fossor]
MDHTIVPEEWEERAFEKAEFGVLRVYVNKRTGDIAFNANDVARCLGLEPYDLTDILNKNELSTLSVPAITESDFEQFCKELEG